MKGQPPPSQLKLELFMFPWGRLQGERTQGFFFFFFKSSPEVIFIDFRERKGEREKHQTCSLGMCPDQELNLQPFGVWGDPATVPGQSSSRLLNSCT